MQGVLFSQMRPPEGWEADFHDWYNTEHIPARLALPGFERARRFESVDEPRDFLAVYELSDLSVFSTPAFRALKEHPSERTRRMLANVSGFTRYVCSEISNRGDGFGSVLSVNAFRVPPAIERDFDQWYEEEHSPRLLAARDWLRVRRYRIIDADDDRWTHFALHELASTDVMSSPERAHARTGPRRDAMAIHDWFRASGRWLYRLINDSANGS